MDAEELGRRLRATFTLEIDEQVQTLNRDLLALEKATDGPEMAELVRSIFRAVHSLKGAARSAGVATVEEVCHRVEEILSRARDGHVAVDAGLLSVLFSTADLLGDAAERLREGSEPAAATLEGFFDRLDAFEPGSVPAAVEGGTWETGPAVASDASPPAAPFPEPASPRETAVVSDAAADRPRATPAVRVAAEKLDALLATSGELLVARHRVSSRPGEVGALRELVRGTRAECAELQRGRAASTSPERIGTLLQRLDRELERLARSLRADDRRIEQLSASLDADVRRVRMLPFSDACQGFDRMTRDLARASGKEVELVVDDGGVELDRAIIERLRDPLRHLVRNAIDHGIEAPEIRRGKGKPPEGRVTVRAALRGARVEVVVGDDGQGLDLDALREQARRRHLPEPPDARGLAQLVFLPGLSTASMITDVSGRGVGLDVVKSQVESLHGSVEIAAGPRHGTSFTLTVPLTLSVLRALLFRAGGHIFALPSHQVSKLVRIGSDALRSVQGRDVLFLEGAPMAVVPLAAALGLESAPPLPDGRLVVLVVAAGSERVGFIVEELLAEQDVMVKNLGRRIGRLRRVSGATILPHGGVALVLSGGHLARAALSAPASVARPVAHAGASSSRRRRLLVVDDSITTRSLEKSILEAAGYEVTAVADGEAAWELLRRQAVDLVVSDVDMPRLDGVELTARLRSSEGFRDLPVILLTARESEADRARGAAAGANAYLVKSAFDQRSLLETIAQLL